MNSNPTIILDLTNTEARNFFISSEAYCTINLPKYYNFSKILNKVSDYMKKVQNIRGSYINGSIKIRSISDANHTLISKKNTKHGWRPLTLIHPVLYIELVNTLTEIDNWKTIVEHFSDASELKHITCCSIPTRPSKNRNIAEESILAHWSKFEQESFSKALEFEYIAKTDISNFYDSIYTHTIEWALIGKESAKHNRHGNRNNNSNLGSKIDNLLQDINYGQTNGIPQGNILSDIIAEILLAYADLQIEETINIENIDYQILRYRDDYRIFTHSKDEAEIILAHISEVLRDLNLRLNDSKTLISEDIIKNSLKLDKLELFKSDLLSEKSYGGLQRNLLLITTFASDFPGAGSTKRLLSIYLKRIQSASEKHWKGSSPEAMLGLLTHLMATDASLHAQCLAICAEIFLFQKLKRSEIAEVTDKIFERIRKTPNIGIFEIWLDRLRFPYGILPEYEEALCFNHQERCTVDGQHKLWNTDWLNSNLAKIVNETSIISQEIYDNTRARFESDEVSLFTDYN